MCLSTTEIVSKNQFDFLFTEPRVTTIKCYKYYTFDKNLFGQKRLSPPYRKSVFNKIKNGTTKSNRKSKIISEKNGDHFHHYIKMDNSIIINKGIHVFLSRRQARNMYFIEVGEGCGTIVEVDCDRDDFVAANSHEAVFMKIKLSEEEYNKAIMSLENKG